MTLTVNVTQEDISLGKKESCYHCPIALAVTRLFKDNVGITVKETSITIVHDNWMQIYLPASAIIFIARFDWGRTVVPFSFELEIPEECVVCLR